MDMEVLRNVIDKYNPWRRSEGMGYLKPPAYRRAVYDEIWETLMKKRRIKTLSGPFGVGKTSILLQLIEQLLVSGTPPDKILYFSISDPLLWGEDYTEIVEGLISRSNDNRDKCYLLLDDCHIHPDVYEYLAESYRDFPNLHIVVAGEPVADIGLDSNLIVRFNRINVTSFSFADFFFLDLARREGFDKTEVIKTGYQNVKTDFYKLFTRHLSAHIDGLPLVSLVEKGISEALSLLNERLPIDISIDYRYSERMLLSYLSAGGLPSLWAINHPLAESDYIVRNYIERVILNNVERYDANSLEKWPRVIHRLFAASGDETNLRRIVKHSGVDAEEVKVVISVLEDAGLLSIVRRYGATSRRAQDNFVPYLFDIAAHSAVAYGSAPGDVGNGARFNVVYNLLCSWDNALTVCYYRDSSGEVPGFIVNLDSGRELPVFVNAGSDRKPAESLSGFIREKGVPYGIMITAGGNARFENHILYVPLNHFLLFFKDI